jgi:16S rRNA (guanine966-N2)-methyltransferase
VREALFNILGEMAMSSRVADLFAGSGALGLEALSRGAEWCLFADNHREAARVINDNLEALGLINRGMVITADVTRPHPLLLNRAPFELILADPPYERGMVARLRDFCLEQGLLSSQGMLALEHSPRERPGPAPGWRVVDNRAYGRTEISLLALEDVAASCN